MRLAKPHLDLGLFTNDIAAHRAFWSHTAGLRLDHQLELAPGWVQHRFAAHGSVIKVNAMEKPLPSGLASGLVGLSVATPAAPWVGAHPDGGEVALVPPGGGGVVGIGITVAGPDPQRLLDFYCTALQFTPVAPDAARCGDSLVRFVDGPGGRPSCDVVGVGYRYLTVQVFDADAELAGVVARGGRIVREAANVAGVARIGFVEDPDGNWIEISARTSLTGLAVS